MLLKVPPLAAMGRFWNIRIEDTRNMQIEDHWVLHTGTNPISDRQTCDPSNLPSFMLDHQQESFKTRNDLKAAALFYGHYRALPPCVRGHHTQYGLM